MHTHTLGWTSDNGCNNFALGWLAIATVLFTPGGGLDDGPTLSISDQRRRREELEFLALLIAVVQVIERDRS